MRQRTVYLAHTVAITDLAHATGGTVRTAFECWRERWNERAKRWEVAPHWAVRGFGPSLETALADLLRAEHDHMLREGVTG